MEAQLVKRKKKTKKKIAHIEEPSIEDLVEASVSDLPSRQDESFDADILPTLQLKQEAVSNVQDGLPKLDSEEMLPIASPNTHSEAVNPNLWNELRVNLEPIQQFNVYPTAESLNLQSETQNIVPSAPPSTLNVSMYPEIQGFESHGPSHRNLHSTVDMARFQDASRVPTAPPLIAVLPTTIQMRPDEANLCISQEEWKSIHCNKLYSYRSQIVTEFRFHAARIDPVDSFFEHVKSYQDAFRGSFKMKSRMKALKQSLKNLSTRIWTISRASKQVFATCDDSKAVSHSFIDENATFDGPIGEELKLLLRQTRKEYHYELHTVIFEMKLAKWWVQNELDVFLSERFQSSLEITKARPFVFPDGWEAIHNNDKEVQGLLHFLKVLFFFEKEDSFSKNVEPSSGLTDVEPDVSLFLKDVRGWISYVAAVLIRCGGPSAHRELLLHIVRCNGIGQWGSQFIQWPPPLRWNEKWADAYLFSLHLLLSPLEEIEEIEAERQTSSDEAKKHLKQLEVESEWVVVDECLFSTPPDKVLVALTEADFIKLFAQFNLTGVFEGLLFHCINEHANILQRTSSHHETEDLLQGDSSFFFMFHFSHQVLDIISRSLHFLPTSFMSFLAILCEQVAALLNLIAKHVVVHSVVPGAHDSYPTAPKTIVLTSPVFAKTTIWNEFNSLVTSYAKILITCDKLKLWKCLLDIPLDNISAKSRKELFIFAQSVYKLDYYNPSNVDDKMSASFVLVKKPEEGKILLKFLRKLLCSKRSERDDGWLLYVDALAEEAVLLCNFLVERCLQHADVPRDLSELALAIIGELSRSHPRIISSILRLLKNNFETLDSKVFRVIEHLPVELWRIDSDDLDILQNMMNDPIGSKKFVACQRIIERLSWETTDTHGQLMIEQHLQRTFAYHLGSRIIDLQNLQRKQRSMMYKTTLVTQETISSISQQLFSNEIPRIFNDDEKDFESWTWNILLKLMLYQKPRALNIYHTSSSLERPFESLETPSLANLRANADTHAISAYIVLLVSEIGHDYRYFETSGWKLLGIIHQTAPAENFLHLSFCLFETFAGGMGIQIFDTREYSTLFKGYFGRNMPNSIEALANHSVLRMFEKTLVSCTKLNETDHLFVSNYWFNAIFEDKSWHSSTCSLFFLDRLCETFIISGMVAKLMPALKNEYQKMLVEFQKKVEKFSKISYAHPLESIYTLASTISHESIKPVFPSLVPQSIGNGLWDILGSSDKACVSPWLCYACLCVETSTEREMLRQIDRALERDPELKIENVLEGTGRSIDSFSIVRWLKVLLSLPREHPSLTLYLQAFLSLYYERQTSGACLGERCIQSQPALFNSLLDFLEDVRKKSNAEVSKLYSAALMWLKDSRLVAVPRPKIDKTEIYQHELLEECNVFTSSNSLWLRFLRDTKPLSSISNHSMTSLSAREDVLFANGNKVSSGIDKSTTQLSVLLAPLVVFRAPVVANTRTWSLNTVINLLNAELEVIVQNRKSSEVLLERLEKINDSWLQALSQLYIIEKKRIQIEKECSSKCSGHAIVQVDITQAVLNNDAQQAANDCVQQADVLLLMDYIDNRVCSAGLKLLSSIDWIRNHLESNDANIPVKVSTLFFDTLDMLLSSSYHAPSIFVLQESVKSLGERIVKSSQNHTQLVHSLLLKGENTDILSSLFNPSNLPMEVVSFYQSLVNALSDNDIDVVFKRFDVKYWFESDELYSASLQMELFTTVLGAFKKKSNSKIFRTHMNEILRQYRCKHWVSFVAQIIESSLSATIEPTIIKDIVEELQGHEFQLNWAEILMRVQESPLESSTTHELLDCLEKICNDRTKFRPILLNKELADFLMCLTCLSVVLTRNGMGANSLEVQHKAFSVFLPWILLDRRVNAIPKYQCVCVLKDEDIPYVENALDVFMRLMAILFDRYYEFNSFLWDFYVDLIDSSMDFKFLDAFHNACLALDWSDFNIDATVLEKVVGWIDGVSVDKRTLHFFFSILRQNRVGYRNSSNLKFWRVVFRLIHHLKLIWRSESDQKSVVQDLEETILTKLEQRVLSQDMYSSVISIMPKEWDDPATSIYITKSESVIPLTVALSFLRDIGGLKGPDEFNIENAVQYTQLCCSLIKEQILRESYIPALRISGPTFDVEKLDVVISEILQLFDDPLILPDVLKGIITTFNNCPRESACFPLIWEGLKGGLLKSNHPMTYMKAVYAISSVEHMAMFCEKCIKAHLDLTLDAQQWRTIFDVYETSELEEPTLIRHCLKNALAYTLYAHANKQVGLRKGNLDGIILIGEQVGVWIESIQTENVQKGQESKILLLLVLFAKLMRIEFESLVNTESHSRLRVHLARISQSLMKWSEERSYDGIWAQLGFGPSSRLAIDFRLICRFLTVFIMTRLLDEDSEEQRAKVLEKFSSLGAQRDFQNYDELICECMAILENRSNVLSDLERFINSLALRIYSTSWIILSD